MNEYNEISIKDIMLDIWNKKHIIAIIIVISIFIGVMYNFFIVTPMYESNTQVLLDKNDASIEMYAKNYEIINEICSALNLEPFYVNQNVKINLDKPTKMITITAISDNADLACNMVNEYLKVLKTKLEQTYDIKTYNILQQVKPADKPYNIDYGKTIAIATVAGLFISGIYIIFISNSNKNEIIKLIESNKLMCLGKIEKEEIKSNKPTSYITQKDNVINELKKIVANIEFSKVVQKPSTIFITGTEEGVGTSYIISNLALRYAKTGKRVLIIDSDFNNGVQSKIFNIPASKVGLTEIIARISDVNVIDISRYTNEVEENVFLIPVGEAIIEEELFISDKAQTILDLLTKHFDIILIDGKPITKSSSAITWANASDATVLVLENNNAKIKSLVEAKESIEAVNGKISGVILNKVI